jgi:hypothetical protein
MSMTTGVYRPAHHVDCGKVDQARPRIRGETSCKPGNFFAPSLKRNELCRFTIQQFEFAIGNAETGTIEFQTLGLHALGDKGEFH